MIKRRRPDLAHGGMTPAVIAILLGGWAARSSAPYPADEDDDAVWDLFLLDDGGLARLWTEHAEWLQQEAARWHVVRTFDVDGQPCFFSEALARLRSTL